MSVFILSMRKLSSRSINITTANKWDFMEAVSLIPYLSNNHILRISKGTVMLTWHSPHYMLRNMFLLTHWGRVTHICVGKLTIIGSYNGLSPERRQAIIWTNAGILLIGPLGTNFSEILIEIQTFSLKKIRLKMSSAKCCSFCLDLNLLIVGHAIWTWYAIMCHILHHATKREGLHRLKFKGTTFQPWPIRVIRKRMRYKI